jgi:hypothetical protein
MRLRPDVRATRPLTSRSAAQNAAFVASNLRGTTRARPEGLERRHPAERGGEGQTESMLTPFFEARAWRVATQIVRRAPAMLTLLESEFGDGFYILHSVVPRDAANPRDAYERRLVDINRHGTKLDRPGQDFPPELVEDARKSELLFDRAPQLYRRITAELGLPDPRPLPPSTAETLSFRFIVAWLQLNSALGRSYACWQGVDAWCAVRARYFRTFPQPDVASLAVERTVDLGRWHPEYRFWFIVEGADGQAPPVTCVGSDGVVRTPDGATFDIEVIRRDGDGNIWAPVAAVRTHLESTGLISPA